MSTEESQLQRSSSVVVETFGIHLMELLYPWILTGKNGLPLINKAAYGQWLKYLSFIIDRQRFHPHKLFNPLFDDRYLLGIAADETILLQQHRLMYIQNLCDNLIDQVFLPIRRRREQTKRSAAIVVPPVKVPIRQIQAWGYFAVQAYCVEKGSQNLSDTIYHYVTHELFPSLIPKIQDHATQPPEKTAIEKFIDENCCILQEIVDYVTTVHQIFDQLGHVLLPLFKYLNRFHVQYNAIECLEDVLTHTFQDLFIRPLFEGNVHSEAALILYLQQRAPPSQHEDEDEPEHQQTQQFNDFISIIIKYMKMICPGAYEIAMTMKQQADHAVVPVVEVHQNHNKSSVTILSPLGHDFMVTADHPLVSISSILTDLMIDSSAYSVDGMNHIAIFVSTWYEDIARFAEYYASDPMNDIEKPLVRPLSEVLQPFYFDFISNLPQGDLFAYILVANLLDIKPLLDLGCAQVASMMKGKSAEEIRQTFNIVNDFTPEEEAQVREENRWADEA